MKLVNFLSNLKISDSYQKVLKIRENLTKAVLQKKEQINGVFVSTNVKKNHPIHFAIENVDLKIDMCDGKRQLHQTGKVVYRQKPEENEVNIEHYLIKISKHKSENKIILVLVCLLGTLLSVKNLVLVRRWLEVFRLCILYRRILISYSLWEEIQVILIFLSKQVDWPLPPSLNNMTVYSQGLMEEELNWNQAFDSVIFYKS